MSRGSENSSQLEWLDLRRLQEYAAVSEKTLREWIHSPIEPLSAVWVRGKILVRRSEFDAYLERHRMKPVDLDGMVDEIVEAVTSGR